MRSSPEVTRLQQGIQVILQTDGVFTEFSLCCKIIHQTQAALLCLWVHTGTLRLEAQQDFKCAVIENVHRHFHSLENIRSCVFWQRGILPRLGLLRNRIHILQFYGVAAACRRPNTELCADITTRNMCLKKRGMNRRLDTCGWFSSTTQSCSSLVMPNILLLRIL